MKTKLFYGLSCSLLLAACSSTPVAPVSDSSLKGYSLEVRGDLDEQPLQASRSVPPVVSKLLRQSEEASEQQDWQKAESYLQRALRISPKNAVLWNRMAATKLQQGKFSQAVQFAKKSNAISTDSGLQAKNRKIIELASNR